MKLRHLKIHPVKRFSSSIVVHKINKKIDIQQHFLKAQIKKKFCDGNKLTVNLKRVQKMID